MKLISKHVMLKHAGLSLVFVILPFIMPRGGILGRIGLGMTSIGFLLNFPGLILAKSAVRIFHLYHLPHWVFALVMILLTELTVFVIPMFVTTSVRRKRKAEHDAAQDGESAGATSPPVS